MTTFWAAAASGLVAGALHVWSGPDHLSAVAPLAAARQGRPWEAGLRWGLGHSAGVALVGLLSLVLRDLMPVSLVSAWGERAVGIVLIGIGLWGLRRAFATHVHSHRHGHAGTEHVHIHVHHGGADHTHPLAHRHLHAAFGVGALHGLAGSSHFLGVLPALAFPETSQAVSYLVAYGAGTVLSMSLFAAGIGRLSARFGLRGPRGQRSLLATCSAAAVAVGCFWLLP
jgi:hypothetical protein